MLTFLGGDPIWRAKAAQEVEGLLRQYDTPLPKSNLDSDPSKTHTPSLSSRLARIPLEAWETQTPVLDAIIRETTRVAQPHTAMRRNLGPNLYIEDKIVPSGAYVIYPFSDVHLDESIYPDPWKFDPSRPEPDAGTTPFGYVGWGGGRTVCLGTRLAKVELKLVAAMVVEAFEYGVVDGAGAPTPVPTPNWNDILLCRPPKGSFALGYKRRAVEL